MSRTKTTSGRLSKSNASRAASSNGNSADGPGSNAIAELKLTEGEVRVLAVFRRYLMPAGQMLCLNNTDVGSMKADLEQLISHGLLVSEDFRSGYSLTPLGYQAMSELCE